MKNGILIFVILFSLLRYLSAQNLILNPGFEASSSDFIREFPTIESTNDIMKECGSCLNNWNKSGPAWADLYIKISVLPNSCPKKVFGRSYAAIEVIPHGDSLTMSNNNGFLGTKLKTPMIKGKKYHVSFEVGVSKYMSTISPNSFGILFSEDLVKVDQIRTLKMQPHVYLPNTIDSSGEFEILESEFISDKEYKYAILGCFTDVANFKMQKIAPLGKSEFFSALNGIPRAILLIDEVRVLEILDNKNLEKIINFNVDIKNIQFEFGKSILTQIGKDELDKLYSLLLKLPYLKIKIEGHTDDHGENDFNMILSNERVNQILNYLVNKGIQPDRLAAKGFGETKPLVPNTSEENRALNRRVEIKVLK